MIKQYSSVYYSVEQQDLKLTRQVIGLQLSSYSLVSSRMIFASLNSRSCMGLTLNTIYQYVSSLCQLISLEQCCECKVRDV